MNERKYTQYIASASANAYMRVERVRSAFQCVMTVALCMVYGNNMLKSLLAKYAYRFFRRIYYGNEMESII